MYKKNRPSTLSNRKRRNDQADNLGAKITFRLTAEEAAELREKSANRGLTLSNYCRLVILRRKVPDLSAETLDSIRKLIGMANNLNQIAHYVNTRREIDQWVAQSIKELLSEVKKTKSSLTTQ